MRPSATLARRAVSVQNVDGFSYDRMLVTAIHAYRFIGLETNVPKRRTFDDLVREQQYAPTHVLSRAHRTNSGFCKSGNADTNAFKSCSSRAVRASPRTCLPAKLRTKSRTG